MNLPSEDAIQEQNEKYVWHYDGQYRRPQTVQIGFYSLKFLPRVRMAMVVLQPTFL